jgi:hypothetical protein
MDASVMNVSTMMSLRPGTLAAIIRDICGGASNGEDAPIETYVSLLIHAEGETGAVAAMMAAGLTRGRARLLASDAQVWAGQAAG